MKDRATLPRRAVLAAVGTSAVAVNPVLAARDTQQPLRPEWTLENGVAIVLQDCSNVQITGNSLEAEFVSVFVGYYDDNGRWWDDVLDLDADLPMTVDAAAMVGESAASDVVIGGVDVHGANGQLATLSTPDRWNCYDRVEEPARE
ncbi:hypothetical protein [Halopiger djelfimassiliensis]|uniref:hypothetical protein n=1 Tax=Halopiger djelfimassiliensis TaxID=1293047 RepID=UPI0006777CC0|nr:hypothetical protein [Halopiger djelfimassiliensis]